MENKKEEKQQIEFTEEFLKGAIADAMASGQNELKTLLGDKINEFKKGFEDQLAEMKKPVEKKKIDYLETDESDGDIPVMPKAFKSLGHQLQAIAAAKENPAFQSKGLKAIGEWQHINKAALGQNEGQPNEGGFLVQTEFQDMLLRKLAESEVLQNRATVVQIGNIFNGTSIPFINETSRKDGSRGGGITVTRTPEAGTINPSTTDIGRFEKKLKKMTGAVYMTEELMADTTQLNSLMPDLFAREFRFQKNDEMYNGDGANGMKGILNEDALVTVEIEDGQTLDGTPIAAKNIFKMWSRSYAPGRPNSVWNINQDIEPALFTMSLSVGTAGVPVYLPAGGLSASPFGMLMGRPVIPLEQAATLGTVGDITFNDWSQYLVIEKAGLVASFSPHVQFLTDQTVFKFVMRNNGGSWWSAPLTPFKGTNTQSPFIALAART